MTTSGIRYPFPIDRDLYAWPTFSDVIDPRGRSLRYNQRDTILNGDFLALGDPRLPWRDWLD